MTPLALLLAGPAIAAAPEEVRFAVFVGNNRGDTDLGVLHFAESDAKKMHDLFVRIGAVDAGNAKLLTGLGRRSLEVTFTDLRLAIARAESQGSHTSLFFYYSGHGDEAGLELGTTQVTHAELRNWLETSGADVRIAMLDSCRSGAAVRARGGVRGPAHNFEVAVEQVSGTAILTSSAASEISQESADLGGGFFTHYLHGGLSGLADADRDQVVTLAEAYAYVHAQTVFETRNAVGTQTPGFDFDLSGRGDVVMTKLATTSAWIDADATVDGPLVVWDEKNLRYVGELVPPARIAVAPGTYTLHHRLPGWVDEARVVVKAGETVDVATVPFESVAWDRTEAKGDIDRIARQAELPRLSVQVFFGARGWRADEVENASYLPAHAVVGANALLLQDNGLFWGLDVVAGQAGAALVFPGFVDPVGATVGSVSVGASVPGVRPRKGWFRPSIAFHPEVIGFWRVIDGAALSVDEDVHQATWTFSPGIATTLGVQLGHVTADLCWNLQLFPVQWDGRRPGPYTEIGLRLGWRL